MSAPDANISGVAHQLVAQQLPIPCLQELLIAAALAQPVAAWAQEEPLATPLDNPVVQESIKQTPASSSLFGWFVLFSPLVGYAIFSLYRGRVNPNAKLSNFLYIVAGAAIFANAVSILVFKIRWF